MPTNNSTKYDLRGSPVDFTKKNPHLIQYNQCLKQSIFHTFQQISIMDGYSLTFLGRESELEACIHMMQSTSCRLLTILGAGGIGKTHFAQQLSQRVADTFADGVHFVDLQSVDNADQVMVAIGNALSLDVIQTDNPVVELTAYLQDKNLLLVLDNFEHVLTAASDIQAIVSTTKRITFLVTTRELLRLREEHVYTLNGLAVPTESTPVNQINQYSAVQLFIARAKQVRHDVTLDLVCIGHICRLLDGSPLAIELAAVWARVLEPADILREIIACVDFLKTDLKDVPERQQSMRAVFDGSVKLLSPAEEQTIVQLAVFQSAFEREAAVKVAQTDLRTLMALANKSFLNVSSDGWYSIHNVIRQFALEEMEKDQSRYDEVSERYSLYYAEKALRYGEMLRGAEQIEALALMQADIQNMRGGWAWAVQQTANSTLEKYLPALALYYQMTSRTLDGLHLLTIAPSAFAKLSMQTRARIQLFRGWMLIIRWQNTDGVAVMWDALQQLDDYPIWLGLALIPAMNQPELFASRYEWLVTLVHDRLKEADDGWERAWLSKAYGESHFVAHRYDHAIELFQESVALFRDIGDHWGLTWAYGNLGQSLIEMERFEEAEAIYQQSIALCQRVGDVAGWIDVLNKRAMLALTQQNYRATTVILVQAFQLANDHHIAPGIQTYLIHTLIQAYIQQGKLPIALELSTLLAHHPVVRHGWRQPEIDSLQQYREHIREKISANEFNIHTTRGETLSLQAFVESFIQQNLQEHTSDRLTLSPLIEPLTEREQQILALIVAGKTNREIADTLTLAVGTVKTHAHNLYGKLGVRNRTAATRRAYELNLV